MASNNYNSAKSNTAGIRAGDPIPGVDVSIEQTSSGIIQNQTPGNDGAYKFEGLSPGIYMLRIPGKPDQKVTVGAAGTYSGTVAKAIGKGIGIKN